MSALNTANTAVEAPRPRASERTAGTLKRGARTRPLSASQTARAPEALKDSGAGTLGETWRSGADELIDIGAPSAEAVPYSEGLIFAVQIDVGYRRPGFETQSVPDTRRALRSALLAALNEGS
jgi:hypothetical protein